MMSGPRVCLVSAYGWHHVILDRLSTELDALGIPHWHSTPAALAAEENVTASVLVMADAGIARHLRQICPQAVLLHVGHGLISKNQTGYHYGAVDYVCVASPAIAARLTARGHTPTRAFLPLGLIQTDALFQDDRPPVRIPDAAVCIAYAPTWNPSLGSARMLGDRLPDLLRGPREDWAIMIKPHPHIARSQPEIIAEWRLLADRTPNLRLIDGDSDLIPVLRGADLLVSDASSAIFHFLALDRPIVLLNNPARFDDPESHDPDGIEWLWRDIARCTDRVEDLADAIQAELASPDERRPYRHARRAELFGDLTDGRAAARVALAVQALLENKDPCGVCT